MVAGVIGGPAGTNYGENISTMAITKIFSTSVLTVAAIFAMIISMFTPLIRVIYGIPLAVIGGLEIYLFGAIAAQGKMCIRDRRSTAPLPACPMWTQPGRSGRCAPSSARRR